jgi:transcriptional regulator with XRE-family HTH domain
VTSGQKPGAWLRQQREARVWARSEMARQLIMAAHANGDISIPGVDSLVHNIYRWERGTVGPSERYTLYYCQALGISLADFGVRQAEPQTYRFRFSGADVAAFFGLLADILALLREFKRETEIQAPPELRGDHMANLPDLDDALRMAGSAGLRIGWSVFWDKRYGVWRVSEDDPHSDLYAESDDAQKVIDYMAGRR